MKLENLSAFPLCWTPCSKLKQRSQSEKVAAPFTRICHLLQQVASLTLLRGRKTIAA